MSKTVTIDGFVMFDADRAKYGNPKPFRWVTGKPEDYGEEYEANSMGLHSITFTLPEGFHPTAAMVKALEAERAKLQHEFTAKVRQINDQIGKLLAIGHDETAVS